MHQFASFKSTNSKLSILLLIVFLGTIQCQSDYVTFQAYSSGLANPCEDNPVVTYYGGGCLPQSGPEPTGYFCAAGMPMIGTWAKGANCTGKPLSGKPLPTKCSYNGSYGCGQLPSQAMVIMSSWGSVAGCGANTATSVSTVASNVCLPGNFMYQCDGSAITEVIYSDAGCNTTVSTMVMQPTICMLEDSNYFSGMFCANVDELITLIV